MKLKILLKEFQELKITQYDFLPTIQDTWAFLSEHMKSEEARDLPILEVALQEQLGGSASIAKMFIRAKTFAPTRSHPNADGRPLLETTMALMLMTPIDHMADVFRKFPDKCDSVCSSSL